jgi:hypothetical protein
MLQQPAKIQIIAVEVLENRVSPGNNHHAPPLSTDPSRKKSEVATKLAPWPAQSIR